MWCLVPVGHDRGPPAVRAGRDGRPRRPRRPSERVPPPSGVPAPVIRDRLGHASVYGLLVGPVALGAPSVPGRAPGDLGRSSYRADPGRLIRRLRARLPHAVGGPRAGRGREGQETSRTLARSHLAILRCGRDPAQRTALRRAGLRWLPQGARQKQGMAGHRAPIRSMAVGRERRAGPGPSMSAPATMCGSSRPSAASMAC